MFIFQTVVCILGYTENLIQMYVYIKLAYNISKQYQHFLHLYFFAGKFGSEKQINYLNRMIN